MEKAILIKKLGKGSNQIEELLSAISRVDKLRIFSFEPSAPFPYRWENLRVENPLKSISYVCSGYISRNFQCRLF